MYSRYKPQRSGAPIQPWLASHSSFIEDVCRQHGVRTWVVDGGRYEAPSDPLLHVFEHLGYRVHI